VGGEHLQVSVEKLSSFLEFLDEERDKVWVATVAEIAEYIVKEKRRLGLS